MFIIKGAVKVVDTEKKTTMAGTEYFVHTCMVLTKGKKVFFAVSGPEEDPKALDFATGIDCEISGVFGGQVNFRMVDPFEGS